MLPVDRRLQFYFFGLCIRCSISRHKNSIRHALGLAEREKIHNRERAEDDANLNIETNICSFRTSFFRICFFLEIKNDFFHKKNFDPNKV